jgi:galactokinase
VNLIGEHTDYNEGFVLPAAIDRGVTVAAAPRDDGIIRAKSLDYDQCDEFAVANVRRFMGSRGWRDYLRGVAWALQDEQLAVRGADFLIAGDVPAGAGLSSSAAVEVAIAGALTKLSGIQLSGLDLARLCQRAENLFIGVQCGIMDQFASALGEAGHALLIDCRSLDIRPVSIPKGLAIVVMDSHVPRNLADTPYNRRREECAEAAAALGVRSLRDVQTEALEAARADLDDSLYRRARHVASENERTLQMADALEDGDLTSIGRLMQESHQSLRDDFQVSTPELDFLVERATGLEAVIGSRLTGAGFGGCTVNLVEEGAVEAFGRQIREVYGRETGNEATVYRCRAADGLKVTDA